MNISESFRKAARACTARPLDTLKFLLTEACLTLACLAPALFLTNKDLVWLSLLSVVLFLLLLLPARVNAALSMRDALRGGSLFSRQLVDFSDYGRKLGHALKRAFFLLLWAAPLITAAILIWTHVSGEMDGFTLMRMVQRNFGGGDLFRGVLVIVLVVVFTLLLLVFGCAFHSGARHAFAQGNPGLVKGHHGKVMLTWLCALAGILPLIIAIVIVLIRHAPALSDLNGLFMGTVNLPPIKGTLTTLGIGALLSVPLLPFRSLVSAACVDTLASQEKR